MAEETRIAHRAIAATGVMAYPGGSLIPAHSHDDDQVISVGSGMLVITTATGAWSVTPDRAVLVPGGVWHEHRVFGNSDVYTLGLRRVSTSESTPDPVIFAVDRLLGALLAAVSNGQIPEQVMTEARAVLLSLIDVAPPAGIRLPNPRDPRLADVCARVERDLGRNIPLPALAHAVGMGERSLARLFRSDLGSTYPQWRSRVRVFHAAIALLDDETVTSVSARLGWATPSAFVVAFTRLIGQTPAAYQRSSRRQYTEDEQP